MRPQPDGLPELFAQRPLLWRLMRSGQAALPLTPAFWTELSDGLEIPAAELDEHMATLYERGFVDGIGAEASPCGPGIGEAIMPATALDALLPSAATVIAPRWRARLDDGSEIVSVAMLPTQGRPATMASSAVYWPSVDWWKAGTNVDLNMVDGDRATREAALLAPTTDRTMGTRPIDAGRIQSLTVGEERALTLTSVRRLAPADGTPWQAAARGAVGPDDVRKGLTALMVRKVVRRFSLRLGLAALGWRGCGLACWKLDDAEAPLAAESLAGIKATGDVCLRKPTAAWPFNLCALVLAFDDGAGQRAADNIARQWGRPLGRWVPLVMGG